MSIRMNRIDFAYGDSTICDGLSWELPSRGVVCLWGPSGCGKTTLLRLLAGLEKPRKGQIEGLTEGVSMCFQEDRLLPWQTALQNVTLAVGDESCARQILESIGLREYLHSYPTTLSGGQSRRVALARALVAPGDVLLLDEPFTGLDETAWRGIVPLIQERAEVRPVVLVTHVAEEARTLQAAMISLQELPLSGVLAVDTALTEKIANNS